jgi:hypothetical protein
MKKALSLISLVLLINSCSGSNSPGNEITSKLAVADVIHERSSTSTTSYRFTVNVTPTCSKPITVNYKTVDATAVAGKDYTALTDKLTIPANTLSAYVDVTVLKDSLRQEDQTFTLELSTPTNASISGTGKAIGTIQNYGTYLPVDGTGYAGATSYPGMTLAWSDEFTAKDINSSNWSYDIGGSGWGNNELEYYTNSSKNAYTTGGYLVIEARKETMVTNNYTSARMISKDKKTFTYGRIDFRAKLPKGQGIWPALWMLGNNIGTTPWPACGEIDIMELLGHEPQKTYGTIHWGAAGGASTHIGGNYSLPSLTFNDKFHLFSLKWEADKMTFLIDDVVYFTANKSQVNGDYPFDKPFFFIMNVAVGGGWPGNPDATTVFPQRMIVDYVRVFQ